MSALRAIVYVSTAIKPFSDADLEALMLEARQLNAEDGITGALLYDEGNFMQYFEGPDAAVHAVFERIKASRRHKDIIELMNEPIAERLFANWYMGLARATPSELLTLSTARWPMTQGPLNENAVAAMGLHLLQGFWRQAQRL